MSFEDRFSHFYSSNAPPNPLEIASIQQELAIREQALAEHRQEVERLESECEAYKMLLAPLRRLNLPVEILGEIFAHVVQSVGPKNCLGTLERISLVCRGWRDAARAKPCLWVDLELWDVRKVIPVKWIEAWFARSGSLPKTLHLEVAQHMKPPDDVNEDDEWDCPMHSLEFISLLANGPLLKALTLECSSMQCTLMTIDFVIQRIRKTQWSPWNSLRRLVLDGGNHWGESITSSIPLLPHLPASLTSLKLVFPFRDDTIGAEFIEPLAAPNLSEFEIGFNDWPVTWLLKTLEGCSNLTMLAIDFMQLGANLNDGISELSSPRVSLPKLKVLRLRQLRSRYVTSDTHILRLLGCPALCELDISYQNELEDDEEILDELDMLWMAGDVKKFITNSKCVETGTLQRFRLHYLKISSKGLVPLFRALHSVVHLTLDDVDVDNVICDRMTQHALLPRLETIEFLDFPLSFDPVSFCDLVERRSAPRTSNADPASRAEFLLLKKARISFTQEPKFITNSNMGFYLKRLMNRDVDFSVQLVGSDIMIRPT